MLLYLCMHEVTYLYSIKEVVMFFKKKCNQTLYNLCYDARDKLATIRLELYSYAMNIRIYYVYRNILSVKPNSLRKTISCQQALIFNFSIGLLTGKSKVNFKPYPTCRCPHSLPSVFTTFTALSLPLLRPSRNSFGRITRMLFPSLKFLKVPSLTT
jgi:hypothetical protein